MGSELRRNKGILAFLIAVSMLISMLVAGPVLATEDCGQALFKDIQENNQSINANLDSAVTVGSSSLSVEENRLFELINRDRAKCGVNDLKINKGLVELARLKAQDMAKNNYLSHSSPSYGTLSDMLKDAGMEYKYSKQKISRTTASCSISTVYSIWMKYKNHSQDMMSSQYDSVGMAVAKNNDHKYIVIVFAGEEISSNAGSTPEPKPEPVSPDEEILNADEKKMLELVNKERASRGLQPLLLDESLAKLARLKGEDMVKNKYFSHTSPTYGTFSQMIKNAGVQYTMAGENLAMAGTTENAHRNLMNSSGHRGNILNDKYNRVGIGVVQAGNTKYFVQIFIRGRGGGEIPQPVPQPEPTPPAQKPTPQPETKPTPPAVQGLTADEQQMLNLVNSERAAAGIRPLKANLKLTEVARVKARDMIQKNYFSHTSPTFGSPFDMMRQFGISYRTAGENLAGARTVSQAHNNLMNSQGHRRNILNSSFNEVGIGIVDGGPYGKMFVQMFIGT